MTVTSRSGARVSACRTTPAIWRSAPAGGWGCAPAAVARPFVNRRMTRGTRSRAASLTMTSDGGRLPGGTVMMTRSSERIFESACHEGNYSGEPRDPSIDLPSAPSVPAASRSRLGNIRRVARRPYRRLFEETLRRFDRRSLELRTDAKTPRPPLNKLGVAPKICFISSIKCA